MERIKEAEAGFRSLTEAIDTTTVPGTMMMQLIGVFGQFERSVLAERTKAGLDAARKQGRIGGRRPKLRADQQHEIVSMVSRGTQDCCRCRTAFQRSSGNGFAGFWLKLVPEASGESAKRAEAFAIGGVPQTRDQTVTSVPEFF